MHLFNKIKPELKLSLPFLSFCLGVTVLFLFIYIPLLIFPNQKRFYCYTFDKEIFLVSLTISMNKLSLNFLVKSQSSFIYIKIFNYDSLSLNHILLIRSGEVDLSQKIILINFLSLKS